MQESGVRFTVLILSVVCGCVVLGIGGCGRLDKKSTQELASRIESASDEQRMAIAKTLTGRGEAGLPEIIQAFRATSKPVTQLVLAEAVYRMPRSAKRDEVIREMYALTKDAAARETIGRFAADAR